MEKRLALLRQNILECSKCFNEEQTFQSGLFVNTLNENHRYCRFKNCLLGHGNTKAKVMIVGEAPSLIPTGNRIVYGHKSLPVFFKILEILELKIDEIYSTNLVKCYIPKRKVGKTEECYSFLKEEFRIVNPRAVVLFGAKVVGKILPGKGLWGEVVRTKGIFGRILISLPHPMLCVYRPDMKTKYFSTVQDKVKPVLEESTLEAFFG